MILQPNMDFAKKVGRLISGHLDISTLKSLIDLKGLVPLHFCLIEIT